MSDTNIINCPYCAEEIKDEAIKCKHCGEWLKSSAKANSNATSFVEEESPERQQPDKISGLKAFLGIISFIAFAFFGFLVGEWVGLFVGIILWLIGAGSIGLTQDITDAGEAARKQKSK